MPSYLTVASNTIFQILGRAVTAITTLIVTRLITKALGVEGYGNYQIILAYASMFWILTDFGLNAVAVREMAADRNKIQLIFSNLLTLRSILSFVLALLSIFLLPFLPYSKIVKLGIVLAALTIISQGLRGACSAVFQLKLSYDRQFWSDLVGSLVFLVMVFLSIRQGWGILGLVIAFVVEYLLITAVSLFFTSSWARLKLARGGASLFKKALPFGSALLFSLLASKVGNFLLSIAPLPMMSNAEAVGIYSLAAKVFDLALVVPVFFMNVMYPLLVHQFEEDKSRFQSLFRKTFWVMLCMSIGEAFFIYFLTPWVIPFLGQDVKFTFSIPVLKTLVCFLPLFFLSCLFMWGLMVFKKQEVLVLVYAVAFGINGSLNLWLIPKYSYWATTLTTGITESWTLVALAFLTWFIWRRESKKAWI